MGTHVGNHEWVRARSVFRSMQVKKNLYVYDISWRVHDLAYVSVLKDGSTIVKVGKVRRFQAPSISVSGNISVSHDISVISDSSGTSVSGSISDMGCHVCVKYLGDWEMISHSQQDEIILEELV